VTPGETFAAPRDRHLFGPGPKRILALSGGGVRGIVSIAFLERLEKLIEEVEGKPVLLADWFDLIGGTSTGAIIATLLALGYRAADIRKFYSELGPRIFRRSFWRISAVQPKFDAAPLLQEIKKVGGGRTIGSEDLRTGLAIVTKRVDTGSPWIIVNNPRSAYWETPSDGSFIGNRDYSLVNLVRASTAAPHFFDPELIPIAPGMPPGLFVDGAISPFNNPALALFMIAALPQHRLGWQLGPENLTIVSIGTGAFRYRIIAEKLPLLRTLAFATHALASQINDSEQLVLTLMSWLGETPVPSHVNSELGDMSAIASPFGRPLFRFLPYNIDLDARWIERELGCTLPARTAAKLRSIDAAANIPLLYDLGTRGAARQVLAEHLAARPAAMAQAAS
jgi:predicted acylesterase/phospholipase RssA